MRFNKDEILRVAKIIRTNVKNGKGLPNKVMLKNSVGKMTTLSKTEYLGLYQQRNIFLLKNGREPNYVTLNSKCGTLPIAMNYQDTSVSCCPTSLSMATMCLFGYKSESTCAKTLHTGSSGTSPSDLVANAPKLGYKATRIKRNYESVLASLKKGRPIIAHIQTRNASCLGYRGDYGHYVLIYWCKDGYYYVADPTKGIHKCKSTILDKATNGRDIHYYSINIK